MNKLWHQLPGVPNSHLRRIFGQKRTDAGESLLQPEFLARGRARTWHDA